MSSLQIWEIVGGVVLLLGINIAPWLLSMVKSGFASFGKATATVAPSGVSSRRQVLDSLDGAFAYFEAIGCKEGMDAIKLAVGHAFEHKEPEAKA